MNADIHQIAGSEFFDAAWYVSRHLDVGLLGMNPAEHYLRLGAFMGRSPGPRFDGPKYLSQNADVANAGLNPLLHYLRVGRGEGRIAYVLERPAIADPESYLRALANARVEGQPRRMFSSFDTAIEEDFLHSVERLPIALPAPTVSVVMPAYNRDRTIARAIESVRAQTHTAWELLIVDDGSTDDTLRVIESFADPRIRLFQQSHRGVSAARNTGLRNATGEWIFYLDSDNRWSRRFIAGMLAYLRFSQRACGYSGIAVEDDEGKISGYRGEPFDWDACIRGNYVDLNAFCHTRELYTRLGGFDESLRRMVDWDLILRYTRHASPAHAPFIGCHYRDSKTDQVRISVSEPIAYRAVVQTKNRLDSPTAEEIAKALRLSIAIKIPAPYDKRNEWGDFHFAESLKASLERLGHKVVIDFLGDWYKRSVSEEPVVITLRGLTAYKPRPGQVNILWNISHPDQVDYAEYQAYDILYVASLSYPALLEPIVGKPVRTLLQCTDTERFRPNSEEDKAGDDVLFVGNSRNEYRRIVRWAVESGADVRVYGSRWDKFIAPEMIAGTNLDNRQLARHYGAAKVVLNDHWDSMRDFGFVSNRIFDVLASGGRLISDPVPAIGELFADGVAQVASREELSRALSEAATGDAESRGQLARHVARLHSFDVRAEQLCNDILEYLSLPRIHVAGDQAQAELRAALPGQRIRIGLLMQAGRRGPTSSGFIRALAPLTSDAAHASIEVCVLDGPDDPRLESCDACIVQRVAVGGIEQARSLVGRLQERGQRLFVDNDDAFSLLGAEHPEADDYREKDAVLRYLMTQADRVWFSTAALHDAYRSHAPIAEVIENTLDPRLWRDYRKPRRKLSVGESLQLLYMGTATHDSDFAMVLPALDRLHEAYPGRFALTVIGALRSAPARPWLRVLAPPAAHGDYPRFVRWLGKQGPYDVGLAPLADTVFNGCKSDIKFLDYSALGLVSLLSDVPAYAGAAKERGLAVFARNTPDDWYACLEALLLEKVDIEDIASRAADYVWSERSSLDSPLLADLRLLTEAGRRQKQAVQWPRKTPDRNASDERPAVDVETSSPSVAPGP